MKKVKWTKAVAAVPGILGVAITIELVIRLLTGNIEETSIPEALAIITFLLIGSLVLEIYAERREKKLKLRRRARR